LGRIPSRGSEQFVVRMPDGMRDKLRAEADKNGRSMNAEIIARLEASFRSTPLGTDDEREELIARYGEWLLNELKLLSAQRPPEPKS
jgi:plasmid stability protein